MSGIAEKKSGEIVVLCAEIAHSDDIQIPEEYAEGANVMSPLESYRELRVWNQAMLLAEMSYRHTSGFPRHELFGLTAQIRRAAASIPANIAEGYGRGTRGSYLQFLFIAQGSCKELETHILLSSRALGEVASRPEPVLDQAEVVGKMLRSLIQSLQSK